MEHVATLIDQDRAIKVYRFSDAAALSALQGFGDIDMVTGKYVLRSIRCVREALPFAFPAKDHKHAELFPPLHDIAHYRSHSEHDGQGNACF